MTKQRFSTEQIVSAFEAGGDGPVGEGSDPPDRDNGANILPLKATIRRSGIGSDPRTQAGGGGECAVEAADR